MSKTRLRQFFASLMLLMLAGLCCPCVAAGHDDGRAPFVDVRRFGAKDDGTADDTAAIQAAADSNDLGIIFFPPGTYICTFSIKKSGITVSGSGPYSKALRMPPGADCNVLELGGEWDAFRSRAGVYGAEWRTGAAYAADNRAWGNLVSESPASGLEARFTGR